MHLASGVNAQRFADRVTAMSDGRLMIELSAAGELIPAFEALDAVQQGTADLSHSAPFFWLGKSKALNYFGSIPLGLMDSEIAAWLYFGGGMAFWEEAMASFGIKPLFAGSSGISAGRLVSTGDQRSRGFEGSEVAYGRSGAVR